MKEQQTVPEAGRRAGEERERKRRLRELIAIDFVDDFSNSVSARDPLRSRRDRENPFRLDLSASSLGLLRSSAFSIC